MRSDVNGDFHFSDLKWPLLIDLWPLVLAPVSGIEPDCLARLHQGGRGNLLRVPVRLKIVPILTAIAADPQGKQLARGASENRPHGPGFIRIGLARGFGRVGPCGLYGVKVSAVIRPHVGRLAECGGCCQQQSRKGGGKAFHFLNYLNFTVSFPYLSKSKWFSKR